MQDSCTIINLYKKARHTVRFLVQDFCLCVSPPISCDRQHLSYDVRLEVRGEIIRTVLFYILYWSCAHCTVISTLRWADLTVLWIGFCHTWPMSLCIDLFIIVSTVGWTWWDWSLILRTYLPSVLWQCWLGHLTRKNPSLIWPIMCLVGR